MVAVTRDQTNDSAGYTTDRQLRDYPGLIWGDFPQKFEFRPLQFLAKITFSLLFTIYYS